MALGSSPRVRGMRHRPGSRPAAKRIIPASAGNAPYASLCSLSRRDHPRVCGECAAWSAILRFQYGSSPRVRGMLGVRVLGANAAGIIPACAWNAKPGARPARRPRDHPRVCGECLPVPTDITPFDGSSPRVRGMPARLCLLVGLRGIIPACAGNASGWSELAGSMTDHPRVCGECLPGDIAVAPRAGSSPRVRGMRHGQVVTRGRVRIIPACAGNAP